MATIKDLDDKISKEMLQKDVLVQKRNVFDKKIADLRKSLVAAANNPQQATNLKTQIAQAEKQKLAITGVDYDVNETADVVTEDGESISSDSYAGAAYPMPMGIKGSKKKKYKKVTVPVFRNYLGPVNDYIDNLGGN